MKQRFSTWVAFGVATAALIAVASAQAAAGRAVVTYLKGQAEYAEQGGQFQTLAKGKVLGPGSTVRTGTGAQVDLFLRDNGPVVRLTQETTLALDKFEIDRTGTDVVIETQLDLRNGTILGIVKRLSPASKYEVKTPHTVTGIKATEGMTEYQISADGRHHILDGSVLVVYQNPVTRQFSQHTVNAGQTFVPPTDPEAPGAVPIVRPTAPTDPIFPMPPVPPDFVGPTPVTVVPEPVQFVSPGSGQPVRLTGTPAGSFSSTPVRP